MPDPLTPGLALGFDVPEDAGGETHWMAGVFSAVEVTDRAVRVVTRQGRTWVYATRDAYGWALCGLEDVWGRYATVRTLAVGPGAPRPPVTPFEIDWPDPDA